MFTTGVTKEVINIKDFFLLLLFLFFILVFLVFFVLLLGLSTTNLKSIFVFFSLIFYEYLLYVLTTVDFSFLGFSKSLLPLKMFKFFCVPLTSFY